MCSKYGPLTRFVNPETGAGALQERVDSGPDRRYNCCRMKRVLVVDDEPGVLRFVQVSLSLAGYEVQTTTDAQQALELARAQPPDIVLADIVMAPMDGFQLLDKLRSFSEVPVIVFTAQAIIADLAMKIGANDFIAKPFRPEELEKKIAALLAARAACRPKP